ncbi:MAG: extracellular solute-binding protein [Saprospiraceae bacterium]|nr:extracellular solute-binding protein [Saprospiraceae bacterium]
MVLKFRIKCETSLIVAMALIMMALLASCTNAPSNADDLTYWTSNNGGEIAFAQQVTSLWNQQGGQQKIAFQPIPEGQSSEEILLAAVVAGTTPDIYSNIWQGLVEFYSKSGILVALDTLNGFKELIAERCDATTLAEITSSDGHVYQLPWKINPIMTIYNEAILKELGLDSFPAHYSDYLVAAKQYSKDTNGDGHVDHWLGNTSMKLAWYQRLFNFYPLYLAASGGLPLIKDGKASFNNRYAIEVMTFLQSLYQNNYFSRQVESAGQDLFIAGRYGSKWTGPWEIEYLDKFKRPGFQYSFTAMPVPDGHQGPVYTYCDPKGVVIFNTCKHPQKAFDFVRFMMAEKNDLLFLQTTHQLPRRKGLDTMKSFMTYFETHPHMKGFARQSHFVRGSDVSPHMIEVLDIISQEYEACVIYQKKTPAKAIEDAEKAVNILLKTID